jgi:hypothetical protein
MATELRSIRRLDAKPAVRLTRKWLRGPDRKLIEYTGSDGLNYFCDRGLDGTEEWFIAEKGLGTVAPQKEAVAPRIPE